MRANPASARRLLPASALGLCLLFGFASSASQAAEKIGEGAVYSVVELAFDGPRKTPKDTPARGDDFWVRFLHESGAPEQVLSVRWEAIRGWRAS